MPYKFNEARRHKIPRAKYKVTNWPEYDAALVRRGNLTVWVTDEAIAAWHAPATGKRGGQLTYSDLAIETGLAPRRKRHGRIGWQRRSGYCRRSLVETAMFHYKIIIGRRLHARTLSNQKTEARIGCGVLNRMTNLGMPISTRIK
jgi:hypothetical protein